MLDPLASLAGQWQAGWLAWLAGQPIKQLAITVPTGNLNSNQIKSDQIGHQRHTSLRRLPYAAQGLNLFIRCYSVKEYHENLRYLGAVQDNF